MLVAAATAANVTTEEGHPVQVGDLAPPFTLVGSDGLTYTLGDFRGRQVVVLAWFPKAFTSGCTAECKALREAGEELRQFDVAHFAASTDEPATNERFAKSLEVDYPILSDPTKRVARAYGVVGGLRFWPARWTFYIGLDGRILHIDKSVNTATAGRDIVARLESLGVAKRP
ncbi:MAG: redoxin domain-containing protein [Acidobacteria bacterium]|nr:redoxin domain-containing protein [Acidobacteriota bacterium]